MIIAYSRIFVGTFFMIIGWRKRLYFAAGALRYFVGGHVGMAEEINHAVVIIMELINIIWLCYMAAFFL
ncbi:hypothetical protein CWM52_23440 [Raoultella sp. T31]|nr:hypothetical protein CWM52_23440 [Raoultella sp. T31]